MINSLPGKEIERNSTSVENNHFFESKMNFIMSTPCFYPANSFSFLIFQRLTPCVRIILPLHLLPGFARLQPVKYFSTNEEKVSASESLG